MKQAVGLALFVLAFLISTQIGHTLIVSGTDIKTPTGDLKIESLQVGDFLNAGTMGLNELGATIITWSTEYPINSRDSFSYFGASNYMIKISDCYPRTNLCFK
jgi:hypothetical protein